ncbi:hypothetical protein [Bacillus pumilus]|nr:hypothetical protein [Bacillus pumilus]
MDVVVLFLIIEGVEGVKIGDKRCEGGWVYRVGGMVVLKWV